jgi:hypothetical protein
MATLAALLRAEGWVLLPFLALTLWPRLPLMAVFVAVGLLGPVLSMAANLAHYGDPLFQINAPTEIMREDLGGGPMSLGRGIGQLSKLLLGLVGGLTPALALFAGLGALSCLVRRERRAVWLIPAAGLLAVMAFGAVRGTLIPKAIYTESLGLLLVPYLAAFLAGAAMLRTIAVATLFGSMVCLLAIGFLRDLPGMRERSRLIAAIPAVGPAPTFPGRNVLDQILPVIRAQAGRGGAFVVDALAGPGTFYLGLHSGHHPSRIYMAPGQPYIGLDDRLPEARRPLRERIQPLRDSDPPEPDQFLLRYCAGTLLLQPGSRLSEWLGYQPPGRASRPGLDLQLRELARMPWPLPPRRAAARAGRAGDRAGRGRPVRLRRFPVLEGDGRRSPPYCRLGNTRVPP